MPSSYFKYPQFKLLTISSICGLNLPLLSLFSKIRLHKLWGFLLLWVSLGVAAHTTLLSPLSEADFLSKAEVIGLYFTPPADTASAVIDVINRSEKEVLVQAYGFTHNGIAQALVKAQERGVDVRILLDQKSETTNRYVIDLFITHQVRMRFDGNHAIAHNKVMIVDNNIVMTGSFNFTNSAQTRNAENLLVLRSIDLAKSYKSNWLEHWKHSRD
jgi:phosphatidylserine/phosphatidylglycerophosphate/cardiolipin synthase-like enzyme